MTRQCHPQSQDWNSATGIRCAVCGKPDAESALPVEPPQIRSLDTYQTAAERTTNGWQSGHA